MRRPSGIFHQKASGRRNGGPPLSALSPISSRLMPLLSSAIAPARGMPLTSFCMAARIPSAFQRAAGIQDIICPHCAALRNGVWLQGIAITSMCPMRTCSSSSARRAGVAACHQSSNPSSDSTVQRKPASARAVSMAMSRYRFCCSRTTAGKAVYPTSVWVWWTMSTRRIFTPDCAGAAAASPVSRNSLRPIMTRRL